MTFWWPSGLLLPNAENKAVRRASWCHGVAGTSSSLRAQWPSSCCFLVIPHAHETILQNFKKIFKVLTYDNLKRWIHRLSDAKMQKIMAYKIVSCQLCVYDAEFTTAMIDSSEQHTMTGGWILYKRHLESGTTKRKIRIKEENQKRFVFPFFFLT